MFSVASYFFIICAKNRIMQRKHRIAARIGGNFGVSFLGFLTGGTIAESVYPDNLTVEAQLGRALIGAVIITSLSVCKELIEYGERQKRR